MAQRRVAGRRGGGTLARTFAIVPPPSLPSGSPCRPLPTPARRTALSLAAQPPPTPPACRAAPSPPSLRLPTIRHSSQVDGSDENRSSPTDREIQAGTTCSGVDWQRRRQRRRSGGVAASSTRTGGVTTGEVALGTTRTPRKPGAPGPFVTAAGCEGEAAGGATEGAATGDGRDHGVGGATRGWDGILFSHRG
ncbi:hypothetical protein ACP4OV_005368 [Aristida adscensionis]